MSETNVVPFPGTNPRLDVANDATTEEEVAVRITLIRKTYLDKLVEEIFETMQVQLAMLNLTDRPSSEFTSDVILLKEALRSYIYRTRYVPHHLHDHVDDMFVVNAIPMGEEEGSGYSFFAWNWRGKVEDEPEVLTMMGDLE